jgi:hypothetical protein
LLKKDITYEDFNGQTATGSFYFHLSKADLVELEMSHKGGLEAWIKRVIESQDGKAIIDQFKKLILASYGKKSDDGQRFIKNQELREEFQSSPAYDVLFMELVTDAGKAAEFVNGIIPANMTTQLDKVPQPARTINDVVEAERTKEDGPAPPVENVFENDQTIPDTAPTPILSRRLTGAEVEAMDADELKSGLATGRYRLN